MAIKLLGVDGTPAIAGADQRSQDFLLVNHPVFPFATAAEYVQFFGFRKIPVVGGLLAFGWLRWPTTGICRSPRRSRASPSPARSNRPTGAAPPTGSALPASTAATP